MIYKNIKISHTAVGGSMNEHSLLMIVHMTAAVCVMSVGMGMRLFDKFLEMDLMFPFVSQGRRKEWARKRQHESIEIGVPMRVWLWRRCLQAQGCGSREWVRGWCHLFSLDEIIKICVNYMGRKYYENLDYYRM